MIHSIRQLVEACKEHGLDVVITRGNRITRPGRRGSVTLSSTTSNFRAYRNAVSQIKRTLGVHVRNEVKK